MSNLARIGSESLVTTQTFDFNGRPITVTSASEAETFDIAGILRDPGDFHGSTEVHDVVELGSALVGLLGSYEDHGGLFINREALPEQGIIILADHYDEAMRLVGEVDVLSRRLVEDSSRYDDRGFCEQYLALARAGYGLLREHMPDFLPNPVHGTPVSLERAGLVATRLAQGLKQDAIIPDEIRVVTKRAHPANGNPEDLIVTVKWRNLGDISKMGGKIVEVADFVNPASWASTSAMILSAGSRGGSPSTLIHRSFMATEQGINLSKRILESDMDITPHYWTVGTSKNLTPQYYLVNPGVGDAGHALRHFLPNWYQR